MPLAAAILVTLAGAAVLKWAAAPLAQGRVPTATLLNADYRRMPGTVDSNSPVVWALVRGQRRLFVMTSASGEPRVSSGTGLTRMSSAMPVGFDRHPGDGVWMESVVLDDGGTWYGFYHNEQPADACGRPNMVRPRIGAARSTSRGIRWEDLGTVVEAPDGSDACDSPNRYFVGGVGDLSVALDQDQRYLYLFFSQYGRTPSAQGVGVARLLWAARDEPQGQLDAWVQGAWVPLTTVRDDDGRPDEALQYRSASPLVPPSRPWHDRDRVDDGFWGPAVHWNSALNQYVMLLNRTADNDFTQEGIYVSFSDRLDVPSRWTPPTRLLRGGSWYPQVVGIEPGEGTDKLARGRARFFMGGESNYLIDFTFQ